MIVVDMIIYTSYMYTKRKAQLYVMELLSLILHCYCRCSGMGVEEVYP